MSSVAQLASTTKKGIPSKAIVTWNIVTFFVIGLLVCLWAQYYTDRLPEIASLLGGGGALVWITTGFGMLRSTRTDELRDWFDGTVLGNRYFSAFLTVALLALGISATHYGSVQVLSLAEEPDHSVQVTPVGTQSDEWLYLAPGEHVRQLVRTHWFHPTTVAVKVKGYPTKLIEVASLKKVSIYVPNSVRTPVILFRPRIPVIDAAKPHSVDDPPLLSLEVTTKNEKGESFTGWTDFDGHSILLGTDEDIPIPVEFEQQWQEEAKAADNRPDALEMWRTPEAPEKFAIALSPKQLVTVTLKLKRDHSDFAPPQRFTVKPLRSFSSFVQEVVLNGP